MLAAGCHDAEPFTLHHPERREQCCLAGSRLMMNLDGLICSLLGVKGRSPDGGTSRPVEVFISHIEPLAKVSGSFRADLGQQQSILGCCAVNAL